jgi:eukaryotic-like serine/threonine-protein kinase
MSNKIGRFEIISELSKSTSSTVYKANDPDAGRTIALKTIHVELPPEQGQVLEELIQKEADSTKSLNSQNIAQLYGAGEVDGKFCAGMEYVEGNSLANMIASQEGFSIWDLLDITRQVCLALDHANSHGVLHQSLEPGKVMMQWDGTVKVLGYGTSTLASALPRPERPVPALFHYMSPEQVRGEALDLRSNIYSWGAILYEMVTERKPFTGEDVQTVQSQIVEQTPEPPASINPRMNLGVSRVIMRAMAKAPEERYASGQELVNDLDTAKQTTQAAAAKQASQPTRGLVIPDKLKAPKTAASATPAPSGATTAVPAKSSPRADKNLADPVAPVKAARQAKVKAAESATEPEVSAGVLNSAGEPVSAAPKKAAAAAASAGQSASRTIPPAGGKSQSVTTAKSEPETFHPNAKMSAAAAAPAKEEPAIHVDPMMAEPDEDAPRAKSFSDLAEMPPLKEAYVRPPDPPPAKVEMTEAASTKPSPSSREPEKPKIITRENAKKAVTEIKQIPPKLMMYAIAGAIGIILLVVAAIALHIHSQNAEEERAAAPPPTETSEPVESQAQVPAVPQVPAAEATESAKPEVVVKPRYPAKPRRTAPAAPVKPAIVPGELAINSTPEGAQIQIDGRSDPNWITPYSMTGLEPGPHAITIRKSGYSSEARNVDVASGSKSFFVVHLIQLGAMVTVTSSPVGASIFVNGKDSGRVTPAQIVADKGSHTFLVRKQGYLDETTTVDLAAGQTFNFSPILKPMGITDDIKPVGKFNKLFGGESGPGMGKISVKTQPKGAQVTVNRRMVDRPTPVNFLLNPGNYFVDITLSGYKPIHRVINVEKSSKLELNEILEPE